MNKTWRLTIVWANICIVVIPEEGKGKGMDTPVKEIAAANFQMLEKDINIQF